MFALPRGISSGICSACTAHATTTRPTSYYCLTHKFVHMPTRRWIGSSPFTSVREIILPSLLWRMSMHIWRTSVTENYWIVIFYIGMEVEINKMLLTDSFLPLDVKINPTWHSATYNTGQRRFTTSEVAADWHWLTGSLSNGDIINDLHGPLTRFSRSRHFWSRISQQTKLL